jgi:hypothetical protein
MLIPPLLKSDVVSVIAILLKSDKVKDEILDKLKDYSESEKIHILRFLFNKPEFSEREIAHLLQVWYAIIPPTHHLDNEENRQALYQIGQWWDTFGLAKGMTSLSYDKLEEVLDELGATPEGRDYFKWLALSPIDMHRKIIIWDEDRLGALISLGKYAYNRETEEFLARHLDDAHVIQLQVVRILVAMKSRLLVKLAPWYIRNDDLLRPILQEYL